MTAKDQRRAGFAAAALLAVLGLALIAPGEAARGPLTVTVRLDPPAPPPPLPGVTGPEGAPLIVIDAGHGGHDPGAVTPEGVREKDLTLALARAVRDALRGAPVRVALTRMDDRFLALPERADYARRLGASLLLSLHADSAGLDSAAHGATIYTLSEAASDAEAAALAVRENRSDMVRGVNVGRRSAGVEAILHDLAQRESLERAADFARRLHDEADDVLPFRRDYLRRAALTVLKTPDVPALLFEMGYITNQDDRGLLDSAAGRKRLAAAIARAVTAQFAAGR